MKRQARCWICGALFEAERGTLPKGARFACETCVADGLGNRPDGSPPDRVVLARVLYERHSVPYLDLASIPIEDDVLRLVSEDFARHNSLIPVLFKHEAEGEKAVGRAAKRPKLELRPDIAEAKATPKLAPKAVPGLGEPPSKESVPVALVIAMSDPDNRFAYESIQRRIGIPVQRFVSTWAEISEAISEQYLKFAIVDDASSE